MTIGDLFKTAKSDLLFCAGSRNLSALIVTFFLKKNFRLLLNYRLGRFLFVRKLFPFLQAYLRYRMQAKFGCDISYAAVIGRRLKFPHPLNIVVGDGCIVGDDVQIWHNVTLGSHGKLNEVKEYPILKNRVKIFAGSMVIGGVILHDDVVVGGLSLVTKDVEEGKKVAGIPAAVLR